MIYSQPTQDSRTCILVGFEPHLWLNETLPKQISSRRGTNGRHFRHLSRKSESPHSAWSNVQIMTLDRRVHSPLKWHQKSYERKIVSTSEIHLFPVVAFADAWLEQTLPVRSNCLQSSCWTQRLTFSRDSRGLSHFSRAYDFTYREYKYTSNRPISLPLDFSGISLKILYVRTTKRK